MQSRNAIAIRNAEITGRPATRRQLADDNAAGANQVECEARRDNATEADNADVGARFCNNQIEQT